MINTEFANQLKSEPASIHAATRQEILSTTACKGFETQFNINSVALTRKRIISVNGGFGEDQMATIKRNNGDAYRIHFIRDLDNSGIIVTDEPGKHIVSKVVLRERDHDGTFEACSPYYLKTLDGLTDEQVPSRSRHIGYSAWSYSGDIDKLKQGEKALELSIVSSDSDKALLGMLLKKKGLFVRPRELAKYIDDPFAYIPMGEDINEQSVTTWWKYWFQVVDRGMRGKDIPQPGQTSQRGFDGFFSNVLYASEKIAKKTGHTHLTAIPTWSYVWHAFVERGYEPTNKQQEKEAVDFFKRIGTIILPDGNPVSHHSPKHPITSWLAIAPFVLQLNPNFVPCIGLDDIREKRFQTIYNQIKNAVQSDEGVKTYPFFPGRNLWLSKKL